MLKVGRSHVEHGGGRRGKGTEKDDLNHKSCFRAGKYEHVLYGILIQITSTPPRCPSPPPTRTLKVKQTRWACLTLNFFYVSIAPVFHNADESVDVLGGDVKAPCGERLILPTFSRHTTTRAIDRQASFHHSEAHTR